MANEGRDESFAYANQLVTASVLPMAMQAVIGLGVFEIIAKAGPGAKLSASEIAAQLPATKNKDAPMMLDRMLRLLASHSAVECSIDDADDSQRLYGLNDVSNYFVPNKDGVSLGPMLALIQDKVFMDSWSQLKEAITEGGVPFDRVHGTHAFEYLGLDPRFNEVFNIAMYNYTTLVIQKILEAYKGFEHMELLVDVGGCLGNTLKAITSKYPHIKGINFDLPRVIQHAPKYPGVEHVGGDMFQNVPKGDAIFVKWILHDWSDEHCLKLLKNCYKSIPEDGKVIVVESILPDLPDTSTRSKKNFQTDVLMMTQNPGGKERTKLEFMTLATEAGFSGIRFECFTCTLSFDPEIEKTARQLRQQTKRAKQRSSSPLLSETDTVPDLVESSSDSEEQVMDRPAPFHGFAGEDPHKHLKEFHVVCSSMRPQGVTEEQIKLRAFPFSVDGLAKDWLYYLPPGSITTWNDLKKQFLEKYFPASRAANIRKDICGIRQLPGETLYEYWERFKQLCASCPQHQISDQLLIQYFYEGLSLMDRSMIDAASGGVLVNKTPTQARELISNMATNAQQFGSRQDPTSRKVNEVNISSVEQRLDKLTSLVEKFVVGNVQQVKTCGICYNMGHSTDMCPTLQEEPVEQANAVGGFPGMPQMRYDPYAQTYNPGWKDHPNFSYGVRPSGFPQQYPPRQPVPPQSTSKSGISLEEIVKSLATNTQQFQQATTASIQNLENQMSQLATTVSRLESQVLRRLPSQSEVNPKQNVSAVILRSGKELQEPSKKVTEHVEDELEKNELMPQSQDAQPTRAKPLPIVIPPPFPSRFAKSKKEEQEKDILETFRKVEVNIPLLDAIKQIPRYAKVLKELCTSKRKLRGDKKVHMGENVSAVLQKKLPPKCKDPGRPFLKTARTKMDVNKGTLTMEFDGEVIEFNMNDAMKYPSEEHSLRFGVRPLTKFLSSSIPSPRAQRESAPAAMRSIAHRNQQQQTSIPSPRAQRASALAFTAQPATQHEPALARSTAVRRSSSSHAQRKSHQQPRNAARTSNANHQLATQAPTSAAPASRVSQPSSAQPAPTRAASSSRAATQRNQPTPCIPAR
ncbi:Flavone 3'-O-methyltransferase 1 [Citrus sinensis]|uniref:Flavone 3'-O-methyltransferase 1 n=1 Tax=Citrus sinensis TaxID=2711 RepID=A0ACB8M694_CITSI|nr:Flavone 3'-O-methyltransferase 1 [Citrus sinensis]